MQQVGNGVYIGDTILDMDPREKGRRQGTVLGFRYKPAKKRHFFQVLWNTGKKTWVDSRRCHEDPTRRTGYLVRLTSPFRRNSRLDMVEFSRVFPQFLNGKVVVTA